MIRIFYLGLFVLAISINVHCQTLSINNGYEKGEMKNGYKVGVWQYFDSTGAMEMEIDYSSAIINHLKADTSDFVIFKDGEWISSKVDIPPRYIGSTVEYYDILNTNVDYPMQAWYRDLIGKVYIMFEVDTTGRVDNYEVLKDIGGECAYEFGRVLKLVPNYWLVAVKDGVACKSRFIISCEFGIIMDGKRLKERIKKKKKKAVYEESFPLAKELEGISYIIKKGHRAREKE